MKLFNSILCIGTILIVASLNAWAGESVQDPQVILQVQEKDPMHAKKLALCPIIGPIIGAQYSGYTPTSLTLTPRLKRAAIIYPIVNVVEIFGFAGIGYAAGFETEDEVKSTFTNSEGKIVTRTEFESEKRWIGLGVGVGTGIIASLITNVFAGKVYAEHCVNYNKKLHENFQWQTPQVGISKNGYTFFVTSFYFN